MEGIQSTKLAHNRDFSTWNMLFVPYCSGGLGQQTASNPDGVTFAGHHIITGVLRTAAATLGLANSSVVVFTGESAGGIGCVAHADYVADFVSNATRGRALTVAAPIGGFYFSNESPYNASWPPPVSFIPWTFDALRLYHTYWDAFVPAACAARHPGAAHTCMFAQVSYAAIATPMFVIEAQTDKVVMPLHDGLPPLWDTWPYRCDNKVEGCPAAVLAYMGSWRDQMGAAIAQARVGRTRKAALGNRTDGLFHPACLIHTSFKLAKPLIGGHNYLDALGAWLFGTGAVRYVDSCKGVMCGAC